MMKVLSTEDRGFKTALRRIRWRGYLQGGKIETQVKTILKAVEAKGDEAVIRYSKKLDGISLTPSQFRVPAEQIKSAYTHIRKEEGDALRFAAQRIRAFHERQRATTWIYQENGVRLGQMVVPLDAVGLYVPGGKAVYPSSVLMNAIPAKVAGVKRVVMCTPTRQLAVNPYLLVAADIAGVDEVYRIGGVQAIAAMVYGTKTLERVDKIVGPGNQYVATAKRLVYGVVDIDMIAGPSELLVIADDAANPAHVAADLLCEAEHDEEARVYLVTPSDRLAKEVVSQIQHRLKGLSRERILSKSITRHAAAFVTKDLDEAIAVANEIAPEHLELLLEYPFEHLEKIRHAGAIFLGRHTPPAVADYVAGPNHVLPTGGSARFFSPLSFDDYVKKSNIVSYTKEELSKVKDHLTRLARVEGLDAHAKCVESRYA